MIVYLVRNSVNGKGYVGITTVGLSWRWKEHLSDVKHGSNLAIHCAIRKYGVDSFKVEVLERLDESMTRNDLDAAEIKWIKELDTFSKSGYNMTPGGQCGGWCVSGRIVSDVTRRRISESRRGMLLSVTHKDAIGIGVRRYYATHHGPNLGKLWSSNMHVKHLIHRHGKKKPVFGFDENGCCVVAYLSMKDAVSVTGLGHRTLSGNRKKYRRKFVEGVTYVRSMFDIAELRCVGVVINKIEDVLMLTESNNLECKKG